MTSDWKTPPDRAEIFPLRNRVDYTINIPGSKSLANRVILLAGMAEGSTRLDGIPGGDDSKAALDALRSLGIRVETLSADAFLVHGCGHVIPNQNADVDIRSAGTVGRFLPGLLASAGTGFWRLVATEQLSRRPLGPLVDVLRRWDAKIETEEEGRSFPLRVAGGQLLGGSAEISAAASTQFASGLLLAAPFARRESFIRIADWDEDDKYIAATMAVMEHFGVTCVPSMSGCDLVVAVPARESYWAADYRVEGDLNAALNFLVLPLLVGGSATVTNVSLETRQAGREVLHLIQRLGGSVAGDASRITVRADGGVLRGGFSVDMRAMSESALTLAVLAVFADAPVTMTNLAHIRNHETDRLKAIAELLAEVGVTVREGEDWVRIEPLPREKIRHATIDSREDHRVVMAFSLLGLAGGGVVISNAGAVSKTFPRFFAVLQETGASIATVG